MCHIADAFHDGQNVPKQLRLVLNTWYLVVSFAVKRLVFPSETLAYIYSLSTAWRSRQALGVTQKTGQLWALQLNKVSLYPLQYTSNIYEPSLGQAFPSQSRTMAPIIAVDYFYLSTIAIAYDFTLQVSLTSFRMLHDYPPPPVFYWVSQILLLAFSECRLYNTAVSHSARDSAYRTLQSIRSLLSLQSLLDWGRAFIVDLFLISRTRYRNPSRFYLSI